MKDRTHDEASADKWDGESYQACNRPEPHPDHNWIASDGHTVRCADETVRADLSADGASATSLEPGEVICPFCDGTQGDDESTCGPCSGDGTLTRVGVKAWLDDVQLLKDAREELETIVGLDRYEGYAYNQRAKVYDALCDRLGYPDRKWTPPEQGVGKRYSPEVVDSRTSAHPLPEPIEGTSAITGERVKFEPPVRDEEWQARNRRTDCCTAQELTYCFIHASPWVEGQDRCNFFAAPEPSRVCFDCGEEPPGHRSWCSTFRAKAAVETTAVQAVNDPVFRAIRDALFFEDENGNTCFRFAGSGVKERHAGDLAAVVREAVRGVLDVGADEANQTWDRAVEAIRQKWAETPISQDIRFPTAFAVYAVQALEQAGFAVRSAVEAADVTEGAEAGYGPRGGLAGVDVPNSPDGANHADAPKEPAPPSASSFGGTDD